MMQVFRYFVNQPHSVILKSQLYSNYQDMLLAERDCEILRLKKEVMRKEVIILMRDMVRNAEIL